MNLITSSTPPLDLISILLKKRGVTDFQAFLKPPTPSLDPNYQPIIKIIESNYDKNILIYGDYDVDGICATAILFQAISQKCKSVYSFVPHREIDGYGFKANSFLKYQEKLKIKFDLLITVDNGIVAQPEFKKVKQLFPELKIVVTDHHLPNENIDDLRSTIDGLLHSTDTSGAGLSYLLAFKISKNADLGLSALGVVADCLPLTGINRQIVFHGLNELRINPNLGIKKLITVSNLRSENLTSYELGFVLGPRINAVGRLDDPSSALKLLLSKDPQEVAKLASLLNDFNKSRQELQKESIDISEKLISDQLRTDKLIFVSGDFNPGIIGLVAGRLTEKYNLPSVVISTSLPVAKGSCRSIKQLDIIKSLRKYQDLFIDLGGHPQAAGFSIDSKNIKKLESKLTKYVNLKLKDKDLTNKIDYDAVMELGAVKPINIKAIAKLEPFGIGNPKPSFLFQNIQITSKKVIGSTGEHLKLKFGNIDGVAFKQGELDKTLNIGDTVDIIASLDLNVWNGYTTPQLLIKKIILESPLVKGD